MPHSIQRTIETRRKKALEEERKKKEIEKGDVFADVFGTVVAFVMLIAISPVIWDLLLYILRGE